MKIIGHRGARGLATENTLAAIKKGLEAGADEIEIDVRVSRDGVPLLWHDKSIAGARIADCTHDELCARAPELCTLEKAIRAVNRHAPILIEVKPREPIGPVVTVLRGCLDNGWRPDHFRLASFGNRTLAALHEALPMVQTVVNQRWWGVVAIWRARRLGTRRLCMDHRFVWSVFVKSMKKRGYELYVYTLNDPARAKRLAKYGLAGIVTDHPGRFTKSRPRTR